MELNTSSQSRHILGIDALRFIAASLVVIFHVGAFYLIRPGHYHVTGFDAKTIYAATGPFTQYGWVGVEIFFVISGFVIALSSEGRTLGSYIRSRFLRLWPTVWICATICLLIGLPTMAERPSSLLLGWAGSMLISPVGPWIDGVYWTLPIEIAFYVMVGLFCVGRDRQQAGLFRLGLVVTSASFWATYSLCQLLPATSRLRAYISALPFNHRADLLLLHHGIYFAAGMFIYRPPKFSVGVIVAIMIALSAWAEILFSVGASALTFHTDINPAVPYLIWLSAILLLMVSLHWNSTLNRKMGAVWIGAIKKMGAMTYPLYLMHVIVAFGVISIATHLGVSTWVAWALGIVLSMVLSSIVAFYIEPGFRRICGRAIELPWPLNSRTGEKSNVRFKSR